MSEDHADGAPPTDESASGFQRVLETAVYGPIGMALTAAEDLPGLVAKGRARVEQEINNARVVGKFFLEHGQRQLRQRLLDALASLDASDAEKSSEGAVMGGDVVTAPSAEGVAPATAGASPFPRVPASTAAQAHKPAPDQADGAVVEGALADYDTLSASQVVRRLEGLGPEELRAVHRHEASHRNRRTILNRTNQLLEEGGSAAASAAD